MLRIQKKIIASKIVYCDNILRQGTGLMFRTKKSVNHTAWIFRFKRPRKVSITMFFVFFPIDIVFLNEHKRIVEVKENIRPFQNYACSSKIVSFIELESGTIKKYSLKNGNILKF